MPLFEVDGQSPLLVQSSRQQVAREPGVGTTAHAVVETHIDGLLGEQIFPVAPGAGPDEPHLLALDATGSPVVVELVAELDRDALARALDHAGAAGRLTRGDLAARYHGGETAFHRDVAAFYDSVPLTRSQPGRSSARLIMICQEAGDEILNAVDFLRQPTMPVEVLKMGVVHSTDGRRFVDVSPLVIHPASSAAAPRLSAGAWPDTVASRPTRRPVAAAPSSPDSVGSPAPDAVGSTARPVPPVPRATPVTRPDDDAASEVLQTVRLQTPAAEPEIFAEGVAVGLALNDKMPASAHAPRSRAAEPGAVPGGGDSAASDEGPVSGAPEQGAEEPSAQSPAPTTTARPGSAPRTVPDSARLQERTRAGRRRAAGGASAQPAAPLTTSPAPPFPPTPPRTPQDQGSSSPGQPSHDSAQQPDVPPAPPEPASAPRRTPVRRRVRGDGYISGAGPDWHASGWRAQDAQASEGSTPAAHEGTAANRADLDEAFTRAAAPAFGRPTPPAPRWSGVDDDLTRLPVAPPAGASRVEDEMDPDLADLARRLGAAPTRLVWSRPRRRQRFEATLHPDGTIVLTDGRRYQHPDRAASAASGSPAADGWNVWQLADGSGSLFDAYRARFA